MHNKSIKCTTKALEIRKIAEYINQYQLRATYVRLNRGTAPIRLDCGHVCEGLSQLTTVMRGQGPVHGNSDPIDKLVERELGAKQRTSQEACSQFIHRSTSPPSLDSLSDRL